MFESNSEGREIEKINVPISWIGNEIGGVRPRSSDGGIKQTFLTIKGSPSAMSVQQRASFAFVCVVLKKTVFVCVLVCMFIIGGLAN